MIAWNIGGLSLFGCLKCYRGDHCFQIKIIICSNSVEELPDLKEYYVSWNSEMFLGTVS